jgi:hypothetical protein
MKRVLLSLIVVTSLFLGGCATPDARIKASPEVFARLSPEHQALVKEGRVGIGFDTDAVRLAVGDPDRRWSRTDATGTSEVWSYTSWENDLGQPLFRGWYHGYAMSPSAYYLNAPSRREREYFKVVFGTDGKVLAVEQTAGK